MKTLLITLTLFLFSCGNPSNNTDNGTRKTQPRNTTKISQNSSKIDSNRKYIPNIDSSSKAEIDALKSEISALQNKLTATEVKLKRATYSPNNYRQVEQILSILLNKTYVRLNKLNIHAVALSKEYTEFFTPEYCDDRVLKALDDYLEEQNKRIANRIIFNYERCLNDTTSNTNKFLTIK